MANIKIVPKYLLVLCFIVLPLNQASAKSEELIHSYFEELKEVIEVKDYDDHKAELLKFYDQYLSKEYNRVVSLDYHFRSCFKEIEDEQYEKSFTQNREEFVEELFPEGTKLDLFHFDHTLKDIKNDQENKEVSVSYSMKLGGKVWRKPGKYGADIDYSPIIDIRECDAFFSYDSNKLKMKYEKCTVSIKEGNLEPWPSEKLLESKCEKSKTTIIQDGHTFEEWQSMREENEPKAENGDPGAQLYMGYFYFKGYGVKQDYNEAFKWFKKSSDQNYMYGHSSLGKMYEEGYGVERDLDKAILYFQKACDAGYEGACDDPERLNAQKRQNTLNSYIIKGIAYHSGEGEEQSYEDAFKWFMKAAEAGNAQGQNNVGGMYSEGTGVEQNYFEALKWFRKSAEQGHGMALKNIAEMYEEGKGIELSIEKAISYYQKACEAGYEKACDKFETLKQE